MQNRYQPKLSKKRLAFFALMLLLCFGLYYFITVYQNKPQYVLPPKYSAENQTFDKIISLINSDNTDTIPYEEEFNCVDSV